MTFHRKEEAEGGCGVIGIASSVPVAGRHLLQALRQMRNRGNGKGGGIAAAGLRPDSFGVTPKTLSEDYLLAIAYLDPAARAEAEREFVEPTFVVDQKAEFRPDPGAKERLALDVPPPEAACYFVRVRPEVVDEFMKRHSVRDRDAAEDEIVYQNSYRLNRALYASAGEKRAFVLSHAKDLLVLKMVGFGDDVILAYGLEGFEAHVWIGHHRYPTKGRVWHPGGAHPFIGMHEALVHNGDFANYASICAYLAQRDIHPLYLTDTEVAVLVFDFLHRTCGYPLEYVIEAMAPTTERDFALLSEERKRIYRMLQTVHIHGSPDGPWFFLVAQSDPRARERRLIGITDTSMLRPQVFALQRGSEGIGFAASEKQAIDAALESLAAEDPRFWSRADLYWNARGGSHTDGGAFSFTVQLNGGGKCGFTCEDKFGKRIEPDASKQPWTTGERSAGTERFEDLSPGTAFDAIRERLPSWSYGELEGALDRVVRAASDDAGRTRAFEVLTLLLDRRIPTGSAKRSAVLACVDRALGRVVDAVKRDPTPLHAWLAHGGRAPEARGDGESIIVDASEYPPEGPESLAREVVHLDRRGFRKIILARVRGHRFIGCGLGSDTEKLRIDVYGSPGDYLGSGLDGASILVHGSGQDQLAQILKKGLLVVHGDVGQTFLYGGKGGRAFILGNAAGRPLINAVGRPRVVINGTCLDYLAESFMAGDPLNGGGFVILNGVFFDEDGSLQDMETAYPGGNLFSLASGGAIYIRDPRGRLSEDQLNGGEFAPLASEDWNLIRPYLEENERFFGIRVENLLSGANGPQEPGRVYRKIRPAGHTALLPEEAWVRRE